MKSLSSHSVINKFKYNYELTKYLSVDFQMILNVFGFIQQSKNSMSYFYAESLNKNRLLIRVKHLYRKRIGVREHEHQGILSRSV